MKKRNPTKIKVDNVKKTIIYFTGNKTSTKTKKSIKVPLATSSQKAQLLQKRQSYIKKMTSKAAKTGARTQTTKNQKTDIRLPYNGGKG